MATSKLLAGELPASIQSGLDQFCERLRTSLGDQLVSVVLYGWAVKEEYSEENPDVNVMVVVDSASVETLDRVGKPIRKGLRNVRLAPLVLSEDDVRRSTDVFPTQVSLACSTIIASCTARTYSPICRFLGNICGYAVSRKSRTL